MYVCVCSAVTDSDIDYCLKENFNITNEEILERLHVAQACQTCLESLEEQIAQARSRAAISFAP